MYSQFYTIEEVAEILSLSTQTIRKLIKSKKLEAIRLGKSYRIPFESLQKLKKDITK